MAHRSQEYLPQTVYQRYKQDIYDSIKEIFDTCSSVDTYKKDTKKLRNSVEYEKLLPYFDKIRMRFLGYMERKVIENFRRAHQDCSVRDDVKGIFNEASKIHTSGSAFEQGNYKFNTKLIYIAKK